MTGTRRIVETPWGADAEATELPDGTLVFDYPAMAILFGIHDKEWRASFVMDAEDAERQGAGRAGVGELLIHYQGREAPRLALAPPAAPLYPLMCRTLAPEALAALDSWRKRIAERPSWRQRSADLLTLIDGMMRAGARPGPHQCEEPAAMGDRITRTLTAILEVLDEREIVGIEQAAFYMLVEHTAWKLAGQGWVHESLCRPTWWREWIKARPGYRRAGRLVSMSHFVPPWVWRW